MSAKILMQKYLRPELFFGPRPGDKFVPRDAISIPGSEMSSFLFSAWGIIIATSYYCRNIDTVGKDFKAGFLRDYRVKKFHDVTAQVCHYLCSNYLLRDPITPAKMAYFWNF